MAQSSLSRALVADDFGDGIQVPCGELGFHGSVRQLAESEQHPQLCNVCISFAALALTAEAMPGRDDDVLFHEKDRAKRRGRLIVEALRRA